MPLDRSRSADASRCKNGPPSGDRKATAAGRHQTMAVFYGQNRPHDQEETQLKMMNFPKEKKKVSADYKFQLPNVFVYHRLIVLII